MGTSSSGSGPTGKTPLVPNWIVADTQQDNNTSTDQSINVPEINTINNPIPINDNSTGSPDRYLESRRRFNKYSKSTSSGTGQLRSALKSYVSKGSGGANTLTRRMKPSISRIVQFQSIVNKIKEQGISDSLDSFNLDEYKDKPITDVLSALTDIIFDISNPYNDIQDDSITKLAYANTINRIAEIPEIDLNTLSNENIELMTAIFIEETIATRVICDIGIKLFANLKDSKAIIEVEENTYQIVSGLVRNQIMPEILATQRGSQQNVEKNIEKIYRIAFDCIADTNN